MKATFFNIEDVSKFVEFVSKLTGKVYLKHGEITVNAKSIIGASYMVSEHSKDVVLEVDNPEEEKLVVTFLMQGSHLNK